MGDRVIYDAGLPCNARVSAIIRDSNWHWPLANSSKLLTLKEATQGIPPPNCSRKDQIIWTLSSSKIYTTASAWNQLRESKVEVIWHNLIWFSGHLPKSAFFLWLAVKRKLGMQDRIHSPIPGILCLLCGSQLETHDHLFFQCTSSKQVWNLVQTKGDF